MMSDVEKVIMGNIEAADGLLNYYELWPGLLFELNRLLEDRHGVTIHQALKEAGIMPTTGITEPFCIHDFDLHD